MKTGTYFHKKVPKHIVIDILIQFDSLAILLNGVANLFYSFGPACCSSWLSSWVVLGLLVLGPEITKLLSNITGDNNCLYLVIANPFSWLHLLGCLACH